MVLPEVTVLKWNGSILYMHSLL